MPNTFDPDAFIAKQGVLQSPGGVPPQNAAQPAGIQAPPPAGFNPDTFISNFVPEQAGPPVKEIQGPPTAQTEANYKEAVRDSNPPTPLSAMTHGFENGFTYNLADEMANQNDPEAKMRFAASQAEYPITYALANLVGAITSPSPFGKLTALKNASLGIKAAGAFGRIAGETGLSAYGASDQSGLEALKEAGDAMTSKSAIALSSLGAIGATAPKIVAMAASKIAPKGDVAYGLGKGMDDALKTEAGQEAVTRLANTFADDTVDMIKKGRAAISPIADEVASKNADTTLNVLDRFKNFGQKLESLKIEEMTADEQVVKNMLNRWGRETESLIASNSGSKALDQAAFQDLYTRKQILGDMIFDSNKAKFNKAPELKREAVKLYSDLTKKLSDADVTGNFKNVASAYSTLYKTADVLDGFGNKVMSMDNKLSASGLRARDELKDTWNSLSPELRQKWFPDLDQRVNQGLDQVVDIVGVTKKIAGKSPAETSFLNDVMKRIPVLSEGSRLKMLNRLGMESAGTLNPVLTNIINPSKGISNLERIAQGLLK